MSTATKATRTEGLIDRHGTPRVASRRRSSSRRRLAITVVVALVVAVWAATSTSAQPWQSLSYDSFWKIDRSLSDPAPIIAEGGFDVYASSATECFPGPARPTGCPASRSPLLSATAALQADAMPDLPPWVDPGDRDVLGVPSAARIGAT